MRAEKLQFLRPSGSGGKIPAADFNIPEYFRARMAFKLSAMRNGNLLQRQSALIRMNVNWLSQALDLLEVIDDAAFIGTPAHLAPHRAGAHLRHVLEFYECFLDGLATMHVDYDARRRDLLLEQSRQAAVARIRELIGRLTTEPELRGDGAVFVRVEDATALGIPEPYLLSSVGRELQTLSSHTIHHFALISMTLRALGCAVPEDFGVAPSTLRHRVSREAA